MVTPFSEKRRHERIAIAKSIYLEVVPRGVVRNRQAAVMKCEAVDVSVKGLRLLVPSEITPGSILNIAVPEEGWIENLELVGEARWVQKADTREGYWLGLELRDTHRENMEKWFKVVSLLGKNDSPEG